MSSRRQATLLTVITLSALVVAQHAQADPINWRHNLDSAKIEASRTGKLVLLHFYTASCGPCKKLERDVFSQPQIAAAMEQDFVPVKLNADHSPAIANSFQIDRVPFEVVLNGQGEILQKLHCPLEPGDYGTQLANVAQHYRGRSAVRQASAQTTMNPAYAGLNIKQSAPAASAPLPQQQVVPAITTNPYVNAPPVAPPTQSTAPLSQQQPSLPTTPPAPAPARYQNRYAQMAPQTPPAAQAPAAQAPATAPIDVPVDKATNPAAPALDVASVIASTASASAATAPAAPADMWPPQLPAGTPPLAFDGYCPVSLRENQKWLRGKKEFGAIHRGRTYLFSGAAERDKFLASTQASDSYSPVFSGNDPVRLLDDQVEEPGSRKYGFQYRNAFYLFSSQETMEKFARQPDRYSERVYQAMSSMDASLGATMRR